MDAVVRCAREHQILARAAARTSLPSGRRSGRHAALPLISPLRASQARLSRRCARAPRAAMGEAERCADGGRVSSFSPSPAGRHRPATTLSTPSAEELERVPAFVRRPFHHRYMAQSFNLGATSPSGTRSRLPGRAGPPPGCAAPLRRSSGDRLNAATLPRRRDPGEFRIPTQDRRV